VARWDFQEQARLILPNKDGGCKGFLRNGTARYDEHSGVAHVFLDRLPVGGFNGYLYLSPQGVEPPPPEPEPEPQLTGQQDDAPEG
jgi:hypothetical protein